MFDPTDKCYQVSEQYQPDKESTWAYPPEKDGWMHAHNALRGELAAFQLALEALHKRGTPLQQWEVHALTKAAHAHLEHIHGHHSNEDDIFVPEIRKRFKFPEKLEVDHIGIVGKLSKIEGIVSKIKEGDIIQHTGLLQEWIEYGQLLLPHLQEEENVGLPLMRAYYTQEDITPTIQKLVARCSKNELGSMIYYMGQKNWREEFMKQEHIPSFVWYIDFMWKLKHFENNFIVHVNELVSGKHAVKSQRRWFNLL